MMRLLAFCRIGIAGFALVFAVSSAVAQTAVKFSLEGRIEGPAALFASTLDKGYFNTEGLDVSIEAASTALEPITRVASGEATMAIADINALIIWRDQNPSKPLKAVFMVYDKPPFAIVGRKSRGISGPNSLEGKRLGAPSGVATSARWPLFAKINTIDPAKVTIDQIGAPLRAPMLAAGQLDAVLGYSFTATVDLKERGVPADDIVLMPMADHGLTLYGSAIIVDPKFLAAKPEAVKGFLRAFTKGLKEAVRRPALAVEAVLMRNDLAEKTVELERLRMAIRDNIVTAAVKQNGYGAVDPARLDASIAQLALVHAFKRTPTAAEIFDASFLPAAAARKAD